MQEKKKVGIFGGSFNPPHVGHIILETEVKNICRLDEVWYLPSYNPKNTLDYVSPEHRKEMLRIAIEQTELNEGIKLCTKDIDKDEPSYMIDTLRELQFENSNSEFYLIIGSDSLYSLDKWKDWLDLVRDLGLSSCPRPNMNIFLLRIL